MFVASSNGALRKCLQTIGLESKLLLPSDQKVYVGVWSEKCLLVLELPNFVRRFILYI